MAGFRNIAVHQDQDIDTDILHHIAQEGWKDLVAFCISLGIKIDPVREGNADQ